MIRFFKKFITEKIYKSPYKPGHYYSPIPDVSEIEREAARLFQTPEEIKGIDLNKRGQQDFLSSLKPYIIETNFSKNKIQGRRYFSGNDFFVESDALYYRAILQLLKPKKIVEVGSGFSSAILFDAIDDGALNLDGIDFIEPYPDRLFKLFEPKDANHYLLHKKRVQNVSIDLFTSLNSGDILFIDSSHVSKLGSDVNFLFFEILPILKPGVLIHVHDILFPMEYPKEWALEGRFWNEAYLLKAFLIYNAKFKILVFNDYLARIEKSFLKGIDPRLLVGGGSLWIQRI